MLKKTSFLMCFSIRGKHYIIGLTTWGRFLTENTASDTGAPVFTT